MKFAALSSIIIEARQREKHEPAHIQALKKAILSKGYTTPILLSDRGDGAFGLVAGFGRLSSVTQLFEEGHTITFEKEPLQPGTIPYVTIGDLSPADLAEAELEENILRAALTWQEENDAKVLIYKLRQSQDPLVTKTEVATEIAKFSGKEVAAERTALIRALTVAEHKNHPRVKAAKTLNEAFRTVQDMNRETLQAELVLKGIVKIEHKVIQGDCRDVMLDLELGSFDTIICDPPYGINADTMKRSAKHFYSDGPEYALDICKFILSHGYRLLKPRGLLFMFCDFEHFIQLRDFAGEHQYQGIVQRYSTWRTPVIWRKGDDGHAPWGKGGFLRTYEIFLLLSKGEKELKTGGPDILDFPRPSKGERVHAAEKPVDLLSYLLSKAGDPGDLVLDPCAGSGSILDAATRQQMKAVAIELDQNYYTSALARLTREPRQKPPATISESELLS